ncbi:MAG: alpha-galactosidase [Pirellulales bacterium]|nr:alpha-galactosidase [Pirellulales bacterium]
MIARTTVGPFFLLHVAVAQLPLAAAPSISYRSGDVTYSEALVEGRWCSQQWSVGADPPSSQSNPTEAFELVVLTVDEDGTRHEHSLNDAWKWVGEYEQQTARGNRRRSVMLRHSQLPVELQIHTELDGTPVLKRWLEIKNTGPQRIAIEKLVVWSGSIWNTDGQNTDGDFQVGRSQRDDNGHEGWFGWQPLTAGRNEFSQYKGVAYDDPFFIVGNKTCGQYVFAQLALPASYQIVLEVVHGLRFGLGPAAESHRLRVVDPGETVSSPAVHLGLTAGDFDQAVQAMHRHIRQSVLPPRPADEAYRIQVLMPEDRQTVYRGDSYNEQNVKKSMAVAAAIGAELFVVDGPTWARGFGDWVPKEAWFPSGLGPLREFAHQHKLLFALYAEPEGGRGDWSAAKAYQEHPEWFSELVLNLSYPEAAEYMETEWREIVERYKIDMYRHDINVVAQRDGSIRQYGTFKESGCWRHYDVLGSLVQRMQEAYPNTIFQQASGGGTRLDLATVGGWDEHFSSDENRYPHVYRMTAGMSVFLPPEIVVTPNGMYAPHLAPDIVTTLRGAYTLGNTPMLFNQLMPPDVDQFQEVNLALFRRYANLYKSFIRPLLSDVNVYHHAPVNETGGVESGDWFAMEFVSPTKQRGWATVIRLSDEAEDSYHFYPRGLDTAKNYQVTRDNSGNTTIVSGQTLISEGIQIDLKSQAGSDRVIPAQPESELILFEAQ